ncbi:aminoglycoside phosphotransferase family protein [Micromonospora sp. WMMD882]|uniref:phosphotransferase family protein n=1 Tax=Micromonospora sp. WMMD882 TaxID=3015151 RepID=UPI00248B8AFC|nr:aminoglycoside phosphotransferase family protein [Micromonospora sp. WMMD882]WBB79664.1 aminoglycoside phosphotransferase family protein [Micromonospora sp. WMMD882]
MRVVSLPPVPYDATADRPAWETLPAGLRAAVEARIDGKVRSAEVATAGFTRGFAGLLTSADGAAVFVKAASLTRQPHLVDWYAREAAILRRLPAGLPVPRPRWTLEAAGWFAIGQDPIDGRVPALPWRPADLAATLTTYAEVTAALAGPPAELVGLGLPRLADLARDDLSWWAEVAAGREPRPELPASVAARLPELVALESLLPGYATTDGLTHGDLRLDNVLVDRAGRAWLCDWTWLCHGPAWFDLAGLLLTGYASGLDADALFAGHPAAADAPPDALDAALAALSGYFLTSADAPPHPAPHSAGSPSAGSPRPSSPPATSPPAAPPPTGSPPVVAGTASGHRRAHQRYSGHLALRWLADRQGWR